MRCYYQVGSAEEWVRGEVNTHNGGKTAYFRSRNYRDDVSAEVTLWDPELNVHDSGFTLTGWVPVGDGMHRLETVEVRTKVPAKSKAR